MGQAKNFAAIIGAKKQQTPEKKVAKPKKAGEEASNVVAMPPKASKVEAEIRPKRLTIDIDPELHEKFRIKCFSDRTTMADIMRNWIEEHCD